MEKQVSMNTYSYSLWYGTVIGEGKNLVSMDSHRLEEQ